ncbi:MAG: hypothetical protein WBE26_14105, partial [Phycisphaerae bacterium]
TIPGVENFTLAINDSPDSTTIGGITVTEVKTMTITGTGNVLLGTVGGATTDAMTSFDASALVGRLGSSSASVVLDSCASTAIVKTPAASRAWISLAGSTGGVSLTAGNDDDTIIGSTGADTIVSGAGDDNLTGGAGGDSLTGGSGTDDYIYTALTDGGALAAATGYDTITGFVQGTDDVSISTAFEAALVGGNQDGTLDVTSAAQNGISKTANDSDVFILTTTVENQTTLADVITGVGTVITAAADEFILVVNNAAGTQAGVYGVKTIDANAGAALIAGEIYILAIVTTDAALVAADLAIE